MADSARHYEVLGLGPGATQEQVKQAFRELARRWHPDTVVHDPELYHRAQEKMKELNAAYEFLRSHRPEPREGATGDSGGTGRMREEAEALGVRMRTIERLYLETLEQQRRRRNGLCRECGQPLSKFERLLGNETHGRCAPRNPSQRP